MSNAPVERFGTWSGAGLGWVGVVGFGALAITALLEALPTDSAAGYALAGVLAWFALLMYVGLVRPRIEAHPDHLLLRGSFRDTELPWHLVDGVEVRHTLQVHADDAVHHSAVISRAGRGRAAAGGPTRGLGLTQKAESVAPRSAARPAPRVDAATVVEMRLRDLASERRAASTERERVRIRWAAETCAVSGLITIAALALVVLAV